MTDYRLKSVSKLIEITTHRAAITLEGDPGDPEGRRLVGNSHSGGQIESRIDENGNFASRLSGRFEAGRKAEAHALEILLQALSEMGISAAEIPGARDELGEDRLIQMGEDQCAVQVVSVPADPDIWKELATRSQNLEGDMEEAVRLIRQAIEKKENSCRGVILILEASLLGAGVTPRLVEAYVAKHGDPKEELRARDVWLVGRTKRSAFRMTATSYA